MSARKRMSFNESMERVNKGADFVLQNRQRAAETLAKTQDTGAPETKEDPPVNEPQLETPAPAPAKPPKEKSEPSGRKRKSVSGKGSTGGEEVLRTRTLQLPEDVIRAMDLYKAHEGILQKDITEAALRKYIPKRYFDMLDDLGE